jgi:hypothetical protein
LISIARSIVAVHILPGLAAQAYAAESLGEQDEVGDAELVRAEVGLRVALGVEQVCHCRTMPRLPLLMTATLIGMPSMAQVASSWLVIWKQPSPSMAQTHGVGPAHLGAHRRRHREAHGAQAAGVEPAARLLVGDELRGPHLVLAHPGDVHGVRAGDLPEPLDDVLRGQASRRRASRSRAGRCARSSSSCAHQAVRSAADAGGRSAATAAISSVITSGQSPTIGTSAPAVLGDLSRVDVGVHDGGAGAKVASCPVTRSSNRAPARR